MRGLCFIRTDVRHLRYACPVDVFGELRLVVVDVMDLDDKLGLALQRHIGDLIDGLGTQHVEGFLLPVQPLGGVDVPRVLINLKQAPRSLPSENVPHTTVASVAIGVELQAQEHGTTLQLNHISTQYP